MPYLFALLIALSSLSSLYALPQMTRTLARRSLTPAQILGDAIFESGITCVRLAAAAGIGSTPGEADYPIDLAAGTCVCVDTYTALLDIDVVTSGQVLVGVGADLAFLTAVSIFKDLETRADG